MRQGHGGERRQGVGTVQGVVHPLTAPPPGGNCSREGRGGEERETKRETQSEFRNRSIQSVDVCFQASAAESTGFL